MSTTVRAELPRYAGRLFQPKRNKVLYGGRGGSKSWTVARVLLAKGAEQPLRILCVREIQNSIADSVHKLLSDQAEAMGYPYVVTDNEIYHPNGTSFIFAGLHRNITRIKSYEGVDICWVEEAERVSKKSWDTLLPTIRKAGSEIWVTFNPDLATDPAYQMFVAEPIPDTWTHKVNGSDNPWFPDDLKKLRAHAYATDPDAADNIWGGEPRQDSQAQILHGKWVIQEFEPEEHWSGPYFGGDFGFAQDPSALIKCWVDGSTNRLLLEYESYQVGLETDHMPERWQRDVPGSEEHTVRADSARPETISYLKRHGYPHIVGVAKWDGSVKDGIAHLRSYSKIVIHPRCKGAVAEAKHYSYKVDERSGDILPIVVDKHNHVWDATRYALAPLIKARDTGRRKPIPGSTQRAMW